MVDYFALFNEPRRPWLDSEWLKQKFIAQSSAAHPDRVHGETAAVKLQAQHRYTELNAAYLCLREPRDRLRHLLELETGRKPVDLQEMPAELADLFMKIAGVYRGADAFLTKHASITSPLLRAQSFSEIQSWTERLTGLQQIIAEGRDKLLAKLQSLDGIWQEHAANATARTTLLPELETICRGLGFFSRWHGQIQERLFRLML